MFTIMDAIVEFWVGYYSFLEELSNPEHIGPVSETVHHIFRTSQDIFSATLADHLYDSNTLSSLPAFNTSEKTKNIFFSLYHSFTAPVPPPPLPLLRMSVSFATSFLVKSLLPSLPSFHMATFHMATQALHRHVKTKLSSTLQIPLSSSHAAVFLFSLCAGAYFAQKHTISHHTSAPFPVQLGRLLEATGSIAAITLITLSLPENIPFTARLVVAGTTVEAGSSLAKTSYKVIKYILTQAVQAAQDLSRPVALIGAAGILAFTHQQTEHDPLLNHTALLFSSTTLFSLFFLQMAKKRSRR